MKLALKIKGVFLILALLTSCVAATENKDLPTKEEITAFIAGIPVSDNYIITVFDAVIDKQPTWNCDIWEDKNGNQILSLYYVDPDSANGYGSIYFNELGKEISMRGVEVESEPVKHHVGKAVSEDTTPVDTTTPTSFSNPSDSDTSKDSPEKRQAVSYNYYSYTDSHDNINSGNTNSGNTNSGNTNSGNTNSGNTNKDSPEEQSLPEKVVSVIRDIFVGFVSGKLVK